MVRSRLVARDFKPKGETARGHLCAAMPPLEAKQILFDIAACPPWVRRRSGRLKRPKLMFIDAKEAQFNGIVEAEEYACVKMPTFQVGADDPEGGCMACVTR